MKLQSLALAGMTGAAILGASARADLASVTFTTHIPQSGGQTTYRYFANFNDPLDQILAVSGTVDQPVRFLTDTVIINNGGSFGGLKQEDFGAFPFTGADDTFLTIGTTAFADNDTNYSPSFLNTDGIAAVVVGSSWSDTNDGWFDSNPATVVPGTSILIAQFTVADNADGTPGTVLLEGNVNFENPDTPGIAQENGFDPVGNGALPAPGALALLGLAGLARQRKRYRSS